MFEQFESGVETYKPLGKLLIMGDLNSRTANEIDYITDDDFLNQDIQLFPNVDDFPPSNKDKVLDLQGKRLIQLCKTTNVLICNGRLNQDKNGNYIYLH